jgi:VWFA-related protein
MHKTIFGRFLISLPALLSSVLGWAASACLWVTLGLVGGSIVTIAVYAAQAISPTGSEGPTTTGQSASEFQLRVESNLVVVRIVVRDSQGRPVENLKKEDFKLFDNGQEQKVSQFSVEVPSAGTPVASQPATSPEVKQATPAVAPKAPRALAFYFDDLNMALDEINSARDAADSYLAKSLRPPDRAAIFTSSGSVHTDFTSDLKNLHEALARIIPIPNLRECPQISDYQAERLIEYEDPDALRLAISDAKMRCHMISQSGSSMLGGASQSGRTGNSTQGGGSPGGGAPGISNGSGGSGASQPGTMPDMPTLDSPDPLVVFVKQEAEVVLNQSWQRSQRSIGMLNAIVLGMARMYGQKEIILTSPGFIPRNLQDEVNHVIDRALNSQIVISSLDPKGVALLMPEVDVTSNFDPKFISQMNSFAGSRELYATAVLAQMAEETGGDFFHHNNDLNAGFARLVEEPVSYTLAFAPTNLDGKFHKLQVRLTDAKGTVQARRGYFAVKQERDELAEKRDQQAEQQDELRQVVASREEFHQLAVDVSTQVEPSTGESKQLTVVIKLDLNSVRFRKEGEQNVNTLVFIAGIYDGNGKWVAGKQKQVGLKLPDDQLQDMRAKGVGVKDTFELKPGTYLLREVVQESEDHHLGAVNREVKVP